jgi:hypothetical protein
VNVYAEVEGEKELLEKILRVAAREESLGFAHLLRVGDNLHEQIERVMRNEEPGVKFTSATRTVVLEFRSGQLRYYAGGWPSSADKKVPGWDARMMAEGYELGEFRTVEEGLRFTEQYLVAEAALQDIDVPRQVSGRRETTRKEA